jgi:hypothetical protein
MEMLAARQVTTEICPEELLKADVIQSINKHVAALLDHMPDRVKEQMRVHSGIKALKSEVTGRQKTKDDLKFAERVNPQLQKFGYAKLLDDLEEYHWNMNVRSTNLSIIAVSFRHRCHLLSTVQTLARHESCLSCKLCNFSLMQWKIDTEPDEHSALFRNVNVGKNCKANSGKQNTTQVKSIRHRDPRLCEQGALAMCLHLRFQLTNESFDLSDNEDWFLTSTSVDVTSKGLNESDTEKLMGKGAYCQAQKKAFKAVGASPSHARHFGRCCGSALLELQEVDNAVTRALGNWLENIQEMHCSMKIGWEALRVAAGFPKERGTYCLPRSRIKPPQALKDQVFPCVVVARKEFERLPMSEQMERSTARQFLKVMDHLAEVFLQDTCALLSHPNHGNHRFFNLPFFQQADFVEHHQRFNREIVGLEDPVNDPTLDLVKKVNPIIGNHVAMIHSNQKNANEHTKTMWNTVSKHLEEHVKVSDAISANMATMVERFLHEECMEQRMAEARNSSPYRRRVQQQDQGETCDTYLTCRQQVVTGRLVDNVAEDLSPPDIPFNGDAEFDQNSDSQQLADSTASPAERPPLEVCFDDIGNMCHTWNGSPGTMYANHGGLKTLWEDSQCRKLWSESARKAVRRLHYINKYFECMLSGGSNVEDVVNVIKSAFAQTKKTKITLSGTEVVVRQQLKWNGTIVTA